MLHIASQRLLHGRTEGLVGFDAVPVGALESEDEVYGIVVLQREVAVVNGLAGTAHDIIAS